MLLSNFDIFCLFGFPFLLVKAIYFFQIFRHTLLFLQFQKSLFGRGTTNFLFDDNVLNEYNEFPASFHHQENPFLPLQTTVFSNFLTILS